MACERMVAQGGALHAHIKAKDEDGVEDDIGHRADEYREHPGSGKALRSDESVHTQRHLDKMVPMA